MSDAAVGVLTNWSAALPGVTPNSGVPGYEPSCSSAADSSIGCVEGVLDEMNARLAVEQKACDHNAIFALLYDKVTATFLSTVSANPTFFHSNKFVNEEDRTFADYYFNAYDNWYGAHGVKQDKSKVPDAWKVAFESADAKTTTGSGDIFLGVNAHVQRDLPFVLYRIGLHEPDGQSTKPDHDKVNQILEEAYRPAFKLAAERLDPTVDPKYPPALEPYGYGGSFTVVEYWRELAWRHAEALTLAPNDAVRAQIVQEIEQNAANTARSLAAAESNPPGSDSSARDSFCASYNATH